MRPGLGNVRPKHSGTTFYAKNSPNEPTNPEPQITMAKSDYMPNQDEGKASLFVLFRDTIGTQLASLAEGDDAAIASAIRDAVQGRL